MTPDETAGLLLAVCLRQAAILNEVAARSRRSERQVPFEAVVAEAAAIWDVPATRVLNEPSNRSRAAQTAVIWLLHRRHGWACLEIARRFGVANTRVRRAAGIDQLPRHIMGEDLKRLGQLCVALRLQPPTREELT